MRMVEVMCKDVKCIATYNTLWCVSVPLYHKGNGQSESRSPILKPGCWLKHKWWECVQQLAMQWNTLYFTLVYETAVFLCGIVTRETGHCDSGTKSMTRQLIQKNSDKKCHVVKIGLYVIAEWIVAECSVVCCHMWQAVLSFNVQGRLVGMLLSNQDRDQQTDPDERRGELWHALQSSIRCML